MKTAPTADDFFEALCRLPGRRKQIDAELYRPAFAAFCPTLPAPEARAKLAGWLTQLAENGDLLLPKGRRLYDRAESGDLPAWVKLVRSDAVDAPLPIDPETFAWAAELRFACTVRDARQLDVLLRVQRFLADGGRERPMVPLKERSIELFGHEKRLDMLRGGSLFASGRLSLDLLRCFPVPSVLWHEAVPLSRGPSPVLVIENHSTYHSFARWNREERAFCAIVYGHGDAFKSGAAGLAELVRALPWDGRLFYFGDIDPEGLLIPLAASATLSTVEMPALCAHRGCYRRLLARAGLVSLPSGPKLGLATDSRSWLGYELAVEVEAWFQRGTRVAQELVGWEELLRDGSSFCEP
jgi:hypothetical protein